MSGRAPWCFFFFFNDTATTEIYTLSLHDALPISQDSALVAQRIADELGGDVHDLDLAVDGLRDRKSTRLNSSHLVISYAVFCLKKKKTTETSRRALVTILAADTLSLHSVDAYRTL